MKKRYIILIIFISIILIVIGVGYYKIIDRVTIKGMLKDYKQQLCTMSVDSENYNILNSGNMDENLAYMETFKKYFTEDSYNVFLGNRQGSLYMEFVQLNPELSLKIKKIDVSLFRYDQEYDQYIVYYTLELQSSDDQVFYEPNQTVLIKEKGQWKIKNERIYNYDALLNN